MIELETAISHKVAHTFVIKRSGNFGAIEVNNFSRQILM
jgi:hypothetical protein